MISKQFWAGCGQVKLQKQVSEATDLTNASSLSMFTVYVYINIKCVYFSPSTVLILPYSKPQLLFLILLQMFLIHWPLFLWAPTASVRGRRISLWEGTLVLCPISQLTCPPISSTIMFGWSWKARGPLSELGRLSGSITSPLSQLSLRSQLKARGQIFHDVLSLKIS